MKPSRNQSETEGQASVSTAAGGKAFLAARRKEAELFKGLVDWRLVPGVGRVAPDLSRLAEAKAKAHNGEHPISWGRGTRKKADAWGNLIDRDAVSDVEIEAGGEILRIVEALSSGGGLGSRDPFAERVDRSFDAGLDGRERVVGLYQARYLPWLESLLARQPREGRPSQGYPHQVAGVVCVAVVVLVLVQGASLRAIDGRARKRAGTAHQHLAEGLRTYANARAYRRAGSV